ncbi:MAG: phospholipase D-like domain-containing protein [Telluria sp.]
MGVRRWIAAALAFLAGGVHAEFHAGGVELVQTVPVETTLASADLRDPLTVWSELFDGALHEIDIAQFYIASRPGAPFEQVIERLAAAGRRGVHIRFLLEKRGIALSDAATIERIRKIPNLDLRVLEFGALTGTGIIHAKYLLVDGKSAYIGSQNFDWRSFTHIHETGVRVTEPAVVAQAAAIFEQDWNAQALLASGKAVPRAGASFVAPPTADVQLVASPAAYNPPGVADSEATLVALLADAKRSISVQVLDYAPLGYGPDGTRPYYAVIDTALRSAAARGVQVRLMVSNWNTEKPAVDYLKSLALLPNVQVRVVTLPAWSGGPVPFARVMHSKTLVIDGATAWVGTSNWSGGYFDKSRNLEVILRAPAMAARVAQLQEQVWSSRYAAPLDINKDYPKPDKSGEPLKEER